jgi:hypothetical protein
MAARNVQRRPGEESGAPSTITSAADRVHDRSDSQRESPRPGSDHTHLSGGNRGEGGPAYGPLEPVDQWTETLPNGDLLIQQTFLRRVVR